VSNWYLPRRGILLEPTLYNDTRTLECLIRLEPGPVSPRVGQQVRVLIGLPESGPG
jgi:hypothetical protein